MADLEIPPGQKDPLKILLRLSPTKRADLLGRLEAVGPTLVAGKAALAEAAGLSANDATDVLYMLLGLYQAHNRAVLTPALLVETLRADDGLGPELDDSEEMIGFFDRLFTLKSSLGILSKAYRLAREHAHAFCTADIVSDLRPVFDDVDESPVAATVIHTLRLAYHEGIDLKELYVALDADDLRQLSSALDRALKKDSSLSTFANNAGLPLLATEDE